MTSLRKKISPAFTKAKRTALAKARLLLPAVAVSVLSYFLAGGEFIFGICPFALSLIAAAPTPPILTVAFAGAMLRAALLPWGSVMYMIIYTALFAVRGAFLLFTPKSRFRRAAFPSPVISAAIPAAVSAAAAGVSLAAAESAFSVYSLIAVAVAAAVGGGGAFLFTYLFPVSEAESDSFSSPIDSRDDEDFIPTPVPAPVPDFHRRTAALMLMIYAIVLSLRGVRFFSLSMTTVAAYGASLIMSRLYGAGGGVLAATAAGISHGVYAPAFALAAAVNGALSRRAPAPVRLTAAAFLSLAWAFFERGVESMSDVFPEIIVVTAAAVPLSIFLFSDGSRDKARAGLSKSENSATRSGSAASAASSRPSIARRLFGYVGAVSSPEAGERIGSYATIVKQSSAAGRMKSLSSAMSAVGEGLAGMSRRMSTPMRWECRRLCDSVMSTLCPSCPHTGVCWNREYSSTSALAGRLAAALARKGAVDISDLPEYMIARCPKAEKLMGEINCRFGALLQKCAEDNPAAPDFLTVAGLIDDVAACSEEDGGVDEEKSLILRDALDEAGLRAGGVSVCGKRLIRVFIEDIRLPGTMLGERDIRSLCSRVVGRPMKEVRFSIDGARVSAYVESAPVIGAVWGRAAVAGSREISGDTLAVFSGEGERLVALLSDGMGSGEEAALMSGMGTVVMKRLLTAGCSSETALRLLNRVLCADRFECTVTMDILEVDRLTGRCTVTKSGAAPSFVVRDGRLFRLSGETLPLGILSSPDSSLSTFEGKPGDTIVMMSDGIDAEAGDCPWLADLLADPRSERMGEEELARAILDRRGSAARDDATAMVVRLRAA